MTRVADMIFERLKQETDVVFFVPGGGSMFLVDALGRSGIQHVSAIHEQGAGFMALGHAMLTRRLGVCMTTSGPGVTNVMTACLAAWMDSVPVLFLSGQARTETLISDSGLRTRGIQECDTVSLARPITKWAFEVQAHHGMMPVDVAIQSCLEARQGPCWLSVPQDVQGKEL